MGPEVDGDSADWRCPTCGAREREENRVTSWFSEHADTVGGQGGDSDTLPVIAGYDVLEEVGRGGMGVVYRARHLTLQREVALKMLAGGPAVNARAIARFRLEAQSVAQLQHAHIAQIFEVGEAGGVPWLALEFVAGGTLAKRLGGQPLPPDQAVDLVMTLARTVEFSHAKGIVHRDLKPGNILLTVDGQPKITDFGLARWIDAGEGLSRTGEIMGTPAYMAPEQAGGVVKNIGPAVDIYALGAVLYEMLTGHPPFQAPDTLQTLQLVLATEPVGPRRLQPRIPRELETICLKCLEKRPARRYASAADLADDLERYRRGQPIRARRVRAWHRAYKWTRRKPSAAALIAVVVTFILATIGGAAWHNLQLRKELDRSDRLFARGQSLAEWVLFDHVDSLARLAGGTPEQEALIRRLLAYLDGLALEAREDQSLATSLSQAYSRIAQVQGNPNYFNLGQPRSALQTYDRAMALHRRLQAEQPDVLAVTLNLNICRAQRADVLGALGREQEALEEYRAVLERLEQLSQRYPEARDVEGARALALGRIAASLQVRNRLEEALHTQQQSLEAFVQLYDERPARPEDARHVAQAHGNLASVLTDLGRYDEAEPHYDRLLEYAEAAYRGDIQDVLVRHELSVALIAKGDMQVWAGHPVEAVATLDRAVELRRVHAEADEHSVSVQRSYAIALQRRGIARLLADDTAGAVDDLVSATEITRKLLDAGDQPLIADRRQLWVNQGWLGDAFSRLGRYAEARTSFAEQLAVASELVQDHPHLLADWGGVAQAHDNLGTLRLREFMEAPDETRVRACYEEIQDAYRQSLNGFAKIEAAAGCTPRQETLRNAVARKLEVVQGALEQLDAIDREGDGGEEVGHG